MPRRAGRADVLVAANLVATVLRFVLLAFLGVPRPGVAPVTTIAAAVARRDRRPRPGARPPARPDRRPRLGPPRPLPLCSRRRRSLPGRPRRERLGERVLRGRRAGRVEELEGVLLRLVRLVELHHRRQAARVAVGDGPLGAALRLQLAGACSCRRRSRASLRSALLYATVRRLVRSPAAGLLAGAVLATDARRGADVPLQQPRRAARAAARRRRLRADAGARAARSTRWLVARRRAGRLRRSWPRCCRPSSSCPASRLVYLLAAPTRCGGGVAARCAGGRVLVVRPAGGSRSSRSGPPSSRPVHRRLAGQQHPQPDLRLQRLRPDHRQRDAAASAAAAAAAAPGMSGPDRAHPAVRRARWATRSPGCCPPRWCSSCSACWRRRGAAAHRPAARRGAALGRAGSRHRARLQLRAGDHPPLLHGRARAGDRRARRDRRAVDLGAARDRCCARARPRRDARGHRRLGVRPARAHAALAAVAAHCRPRASARRRRRARASAPPVVWAATAPLGASVLVAAVASRLPAPVAYARRRPQRPRTPARLPTAGPSGRRGRPAAPRGPAASGTWQGPAAAFSRRRRRSAAPRTAARPGIAAGPGPRRAGLHRRRHGRERRGRPRPRRPPRLRHAEQGARHAPRDGRRRATAGSRRSSARTAPRASSSRPATR